MRTRELLASCASRSFILRLLGDALGLVAVGHDEEGVACVRHAFEAEDFDWGGWTGFGDGATAVVEHGADLTEGVADDVAVAGAEGSVSGRGCWRLRRGRDRAWLR